MDIQIEVIEIENDAKLVEAWHLLASMILDKLEEPSTDIIAPNDDKSQ